MKSAKCNPLSNSCYFYRFWKARGGVPTLIVSSKIEQISTTNHEKTPSKKHQKKRRRKRREKTENTSIWKAWHHEKPYKTNVKTTILETWKIVKILKNLKNIQNLIQKWIPKSWKNTKNEFQKSMQKKERKFEMTGPRADSAVDAKTPQINKT